MASVVQLPPGTPVLSVSKMNDHKLHKFLKPRYLHERINLLHFTTGRFTVCYANTSPIEPAPITYASESEGKILGGSGNIFENIISSGKTAEASITTTKQQQVDTTSEGPVLQFQYLRKPLWLLGPALLLVTGVVPTLWLPVSSVFLGANIASLLSLTGLDCIFNIGASLFLLMADSTARPNNISRTCNSKPPSSYQFWNMLANVAGLIVPLALFFGSQKGFLDPQLPFISFLVLLGPYFLLLSVQILTEMLTWHWQSPVWLVTPVVYEAYRLLQLMRGLKLGPELGAPSWIMHAIRGLVCSWVLVLGIQLMRVAWYAGFTANAHKHASTDTVDE